MVIPEPAAPIMNQDGTGARLMITHIVNENFKSYYGRHIIGPFHKVRHFSFKEGYVKGVGRVKFRNSET